MKIPAGLTDANMEIYALDGQLHFIKNGRDHLATEMDTDDLAVFRSMMDNDQQITDAIAEMGILNPPDQILQFLMCNFGSFDDRADLTSDGISIREYWDCGKRGTCHQEGRLCKLPEGPNGRITPREIEVIKLVCQGLVDKQIADRLSISYNTVCAHRSNIEHKLNAQCKVEIAMWAKEKGII